MTEQSNNEFISQETAEAVLLRFGIYKSSSAYDRWLKDDGFYLKDFDEVLCKSPHFLNFDWKETTDQIGLQLLRGFTLCGIEMRWELLEPNKGILTSKNARTIINYEPKTDSIDYTVSTIIFEHLNEKVTAFSDKNNSDGDTAVFVLLKTTDANRLRKKHSNVVNYFFNPIDEKPTPPIWLKPKPKLESEAELEPEPELELEAELEPEKKSIFKLFLEWFRP